MLPVINILLFKDTPPRPHNATGSCPEIVHDGAPSTRVSVEDRLSVPSDPPVTRYT